MYSVGCFNAILKCIVHNRKPAVLILIEIWYLWHVELAVSLLNTFCLRLGSFLLKYIAFE